MRTLAAIMFTDIAGYTALMQKDEQRARWVRKIHRENFNTLTEKHQGQILQYFGDGTLSIFQSAYQAVLCGVELQRAFRSDNSIPVRIGIHLGEIVYDQEEIIGDAVNIAARIESLACAGSVLISEKIYAEIANRNDISTKLLGDFHLKNVFNPIKVYAVAEEGLYVPDRHELKGKVENKEKIISLPSFHNAFIGRGYQVRSIRSLLQQENSRLVTILGPGGMGKTRLSAKLGEVLAEEFEHGVCFVPLDAVVDYQQVPRHIGIQLGLKESPHDTWIDVIIDFLKDKHLLLILDNLEQILEASTFVSQILQGCGQIKILATSREILELAEEIEFALDALNRPNPRLFPEPKDLLKFEAIHLFVQQAQFSAPNFQIDKDNAEAVVKICDLLEGLPLPIVLAAARIKLFSPEVIFQKLSSSNNLLKTRAKNVAQRHQTIRNTVEWSYDLLDPEEQELFQRISLFRGGFTLDSLEAIFPEADSLEIVESFLNKSLIIKDKEVALIPRFRMLKLIRDYGLEQLEKNPERDLCFEEFANFFMDFAEEATEKLRSSEQVQWMALIDAEYPNISESMEWLINHKSECAAKMGAGFWVFHLNRGFLREGLNMLETLLDLQIKDKTITAKLLEGTGSLSHNLGNYSQAKEYFERSLDLNESFENKAEIAKAINNLSWAEWRIGNYDLTVSYAEKAYEIFLELGDEIGQAKSQNNIAWTFHYRGLFEEAVDLQRKVLAIHKRSKNRRGIAFAKACLSRALLKFGETVEAEQLITQAVEVFGELKNQQLLAFSYLIKAELDYEIENYESAKEILCNHCLTNFEKIGDIWGIATTHHHLGEIYLKEKQAEPAKSHLNQALELFQNASDKFGEAATFLGLGKLYRLENDHLAAEDFLQKGLKSAKQMGANELLKGVDQQHKLVVQPESSSDSKEPLFVQQIRQIIETNIANHDFSVPDLCKEI
ncbi:MAG: tetratricopeptide repeat protein, partial [Bacteroidetes bacterium]|nr:tetratricopeptide repeat protein [Bacteroidota bacterium]